MLPSNQMPENSLTAPFLDKWLPLQFQLIAFPENPQQCLAQDWWQQLTGAEPDSSTRKKMERVDSGPLDGRAFNLSVDPLRVVLLVSARVDLEELASQDVPPSLGPYSQAIEWFAKLAKHWLVEYSPPLTRLAFATKLLQQTASREESYLLLGNYLKNRVVVDHETSTEFQYRINRHAKSTTVPGLLINRLNTWSSLRMAMQLQTGLLGTGLSKEIAKEFLGCSLDLDINTSQEFTDLLPHAQLSAVWDELLEHGTSIARNGDAL